MAGRAAPIAIVPSVERGCRLRRRRESPRSGAPAASDRLAPAQSATPSAARQRTLRDGENFGGGGSILTSPPTISSPPPRPPRPSAGRFSPAPPPEIRWVPQRHLSAAPRGR